MGAKNNEEKAMKPIRQRIVIDLTEYGHTGTITLEQPNARREMELNDNLGSCTIFKSDGTFTRNLGKQAIYTRLGFIVQAPFMSSDNALNVENWLRFMDRFPDSGKAVCKRIDTEILKLMQDTDTPLAGSGQAESPN